MKAWKAESLLFAITLVWGVTFTFTKIGLQFTTPMFFVFLRFTIAFVVSFIFWGKYLFKINKQTALYGIILGLLQIGGFIFQTEGLKFTTVSKSAFITGMSVVLTPFAYKIVTRRKVHNWQTIGVVVAFIGLWLFTNPTFNNINTGDFLTFISAIFWAFYITYMDLLTRGADTFEHTMQLVFMQFIVASPIALLGSYFFETAGFKLIINWQLIASLLYNGIMASVFLTIIHTHVQKYTNPVKAALIFSLEPIFASIVALFVFIEILSGREYIGAGILFAGVLTSELGESVLGFFLKKIGMRT